jgi:hypothetical protein
MHDFSARRSQGLQRPFLIGASLCSLDKKVLDGKSTHTAEQTLQLGCAALGRLKV